MKYIVALCVVAALGVFFLAPILGQPCRESSSFVKGVKLGFGVVCR